MSTNYNILYDPAVRNPLFYVICTMSVVGAVLNLIAYFLFDLSSEKHKWMMDCMRYRIAVAAWKKGELTLESQQEIVGIMQQYKNIESKSRNCQCYAH